MATLPDARCPAEVIGLVLVVFVFLSVWMAIGRGRWQVRALVGMALLTTLATVSAYQPVVFLSLATGISTSVLAVLLGVSRREGTRHRPPHRVPRIWRRAEFWFGLVAATSTTLATYLWSVRTIPMLGRLEFGLVAVVCSLLVLLVAVMFGDRFRLGRIRLRASDPTQSHRYQVSDAIWLVTLLAVAFSLCAYAHQKHPITDWRSAGIAVLIMVTATVSIACSVLAAKLRWRLVSMGVFVVIAGVALAFGTVAAKWLNAATAFAFVPSTYWKGVLAWMTLASVTLLLCGRLAGWFRPQVAGELVSGSTRLIASSFATGISIWIVICLAPIVWDMTRPLERPDPIDADSSVFPRIESEISKLVVLNPKGRIAESLSSTHRDAVNEVYATIERLSGPSFRSPDPLTTSVDVAALGQRLAAFRSWARCMDKEAQADVTAKRFDSACDHWMNCVRVGRGLSRGGDVTFILTGIAIESVGLSGLAQIRGDLGLDAARRVIDELQTTERHRESTESIARRTDLVIQREYHWRFRLAMCASERLSAQPPAHATTFASPTKQATGDAIRVRDATLRLLLADFATRIYLSQHKRLPGGCKELVPRYLDRIPADPFCGRSILMRPAGDSFLVYCVGHDGVDDGGEIGGPGAFIADGMDFGLQNVLPQSTAPANAVGGGIF